MFRSKYSLTLVSGAFLALLLIYSVYLSVNDLNLIGRKLTALAFGIPIIVLINALLITDIKKCLLLLLVLYPVWQRPAYYLKIISFPDGFYVLNYQQLYIALLSFILLTIFLIRKRKCINIGECLCLSFSALILISSFINCYMVSEGSNTYNNNIFLVNYLIPLFLFSSLTVYLSNMRCARYLDQAIKLFFIFQLIFCLIELIFRGGSVISNPSLLLNYGLRIPSGDDGSQIITGGIRDLLYFSWLFSWLPIYFHYKCKEGEITKGEYVFWMFTSYFVVLMTYSKSPIVILLMNTFLIFKIDGMIKKRTILKIASIISVIAILSPILINKFFERVIQFFDSSSAFLSSDSTASRTIDMTVYYRLKSIIDQMEFTLSDFGNFMIGGYSNFVEGSSFFLVLSAFGFVVLIITMIISFLYFYTCNIYQKGIFLSFLLYSITSLESFVGVSNFKIFILSTDLEQYVERYGWYPQYSMGNVFVTIVLFVFVQKSLGIIRLDGDSYEIDTSVPDRSKL